MLLIQGCVSRFGYIDSCIAHTTLAAQSPEYIYFPGFCKTTMDGSMLVSLRSASYRSRQL
jgi:hypothetical protein